MTDRSAVPPGVKGRLVVGGCPEGFDARYLTETLRRADGPVIHVARDDARLAAMRASIRFFDPGVPILEFPAWDCLPYDRISPNPEISSRRMATLAALADGFDRPAAILTTVNAATQKLPARAVVAGASFTAEVGHRVDVTALRGYLARMGFSQSSTVTERGEFAVRGGLVDLFPPGRRRRCGSISSATCWRAPAASIRRRSAPLNRWRGWNSRRCRRWSSTSRPSSASAPAIARCSAPPAPTTRSTRRSAPGGTIRATSTGCPSSMRGWKRFSTIFPGRRCCSTTVSRRPMSPAGRR